MSKAQQPVETAPPPTATPGALAPWLAELARNLPGLAPSMGLPPVLDLRTRVRLHVAIDRANDARWSLWIHESLAEFLGEGGYPPADDLMLDYAESCGALGLPVEDAALEHGLPEPLVTVVRAAVARMQLGALLSNSAQSFVDRLAGRLPRDPAKLVVEGMTAVAIAPLALPLAAVVGAARGLAGLAPVMPRVNTVEDESNLLVGLIAQALPAYLANAAVRAAVLRLPVVFVIGVRSGRSAATVRIGKGIVAVDNGIAPAAQLVIDGDAGPLLRYASSRITRDLARGRG